MACNWKKKKKQAHAISSTSQNSNLVKTLHVDVLAPKCFSLLVNTVMNAQCYACISGCFDEIIDYELCFSRSAII